MSVSLEHILDFTLDMRERRRRQHDAELDSKEQSVRASRDELKRRLDKFSTSVRSIIQEAVEHANHHLATRPECCQFSEVPKFSAEPWYPGGPICNPLAYELRVDGKEVGETLIVELTHDGMIEAHLWPFRLEEHRTLLGRADLHWSPTPLYSFDARRAEELLVLYLTAITERWRLDRENAEQMT